MFIWNTSNKLLYFSETTNLTNLSEFGSSPNDQVEESVDPDQLRCGGLDEEALQEYRLRKTSSLRNAKKVNFSLKHKLRKHLSQRAPARLALGNVNETFSDSNHPQGEDRPVQLKSFWNWNVAGESMELCDGENPGEADDESTLHSINNNTQTRHQSLDTRTLEDLDSNLRAKLSLPDCFPSEFPLLDKNADLQLAGYRIGIKRSPEGDFQLEMPIEEKKCKQTSWCCHEESPGQPPKSCRNSKKVVAKVTTGKPKLVALESGQLKSNSFWDWNGGSDGVRSALVQDHIDLDVHSCNHSHKQIRHRSLDTRTLLDMDRQQRAKLSLTDYSSPFPLISLENMNLKQGDFDSQGQQTSRLELPMGPMVKCKQSSGSCRELDTSHLTPYYVNSNSVEVAGRPRPQSCCIFKVESGPLFKEVRVNSLFDKFHWDGMRSKRSSACKSLLEYDTHPLQTETWLRNSDSLLSATDRGLKHGVACRKNSSKKSQKLQRTSSAETGLKVDKKLADLEVTSTGVRVRTRPAVLRTRSWRPNVKHLRGSSFKKSDKRWSYLEMSEFSSLENGAGPRTPDCSESTRLTLGTPSTGGATFGSDRSYTSSTMTILKSFEELQEMEPIHSESGSGSHGREGERGANSPVSNDCEPTCNGRQGNENCLTTESSVDQSPVHLNEEIELTVSRVDQVIESHFFSK